MIWRRAVGLALLELSALVYLGYVGLTVLFFVKREAAIGVVCAVCAVLCLAQPIGIGIALVFGWLRASRWQIRAFMTLWTGLVALVGLNLATVLLPDNIQAFLARSLFGSFWPSGR
jgi:hypothetical protein